MCDTCTRLCLGLNTGSLFFGGLCLQQLIAALSTGERVLHCDDLQLELALAQRDRFRTLDCLQLDFRCHLDSAFPVLCFSHGPCTCAGLACLDRQLALDLNLVLGGYTDRHSKRKFRLICGELEVQFLELRVELDKHSFLFLYLALSHVELDVGGGLGGVFAVGLVVDAHPGVGVGLPLGLRCLEGVLGLERGGCVNGVLLDLN